jgi:hypothetical protein
MRCPDCPVAPDRTCHAGVAPSLCGWAASGDPVKIAHVVNRSAIAEGRPSTFPPLAHQAVNLAGAVGRFVGGGLAMTTEEERSRRLNICHGCDRFRGGRCLECGCLLAAKLMMMTERCPIGRW